jgi:hypothetical protein
MYPTDLSIMKNDLLKVTDKLSEPEKTGLSDILDKLFYDFKFDIESEQNTVNPCAHCSSPKTEKNKTAPYPHSPLVKTFQKEALFSSIESAVFNFNKQLQPFEEANNDSVFIKLKKGVNKKIMLDSILFIECQKNYLHLITTQGEYRTRATITGFSSKLSDVFIKTHKSYIVNSAKIDHFNTRFISIKNKKIPISKTYREEVLIKLKHLLL